jgi:hypothetical protein
MRQTISFFGVDQFLANVAEVERCVNTELRTWQERFNERGHDCELPDYLVQFAGHHPFL